MKLGTGALVGRYLAEIFHVPTDLPVVLTRQAVEVFYTYTAPTPTAPVDVGVTRHAVEVFFTAGGRAELTRHAVELFYVDTSEAEGGGAPGSSTHTFGHAV